MKSFTRDQLAVILLVAAAIFGLTMARNLWWY